MAGRLVVSTLNDDTGVLNVQNGMTGIAKAWVNFNGTGTVAIRSSFNVSSITDNGSGDYTVNFITAMPNANYSVTGTSSGLDGNTSVAARQFITTLDNITARTTSAIRIGLTYPGTDSAGAGDATQVNIAVFSL